MPGLAEHLARFDARAPHADDSAFLARLYASTRPDLLGNASAEQAAPLIAMQQRLQAADYRARFPHAQHLILHSGAAAAARIVVDHDPQRVRLVDLAVAPEARRRGLGAAIVGALQQWSAQHGLPLVLAVHHSNTNARRLYLSLGFDSVSMEEFSEQLSWRG